MATIVLIVAILAAVLVMTSGVWVATVLIATVARMKPPVSASATSPAAKETPP